MVAGIWENGNEEGEGGNVENGIGLEKATKKQ
jgi:hypothetical protein